MDQNVSQRAFVAGLAAATLVFSGILIGSRGLVHFDPELVFYAIGSILTAFAIAYRFTVWSQRPPTKLYLRRGIQILLRGRFLRPKRSAVVDAADKMVAQNFIRRRSWYRWIMHLCLSGGCTLAFAITFPLVFGWVHFSASAADAEIYLVKVLGFAVDSFHIHSLKGAIMFNLLNIAAVFVMVGLVMAAIRRFTDAGERATQKFFEDILPLLLIFAVTVTGLGLTVSYKFVTGAGHGFLVMVHLFSVLALLFYIPFGKLFHMFQRLCSLCVALYRREGEAGPSAFCVRCGEDYTSAMHVEDLKSVLDKLGFNYRFATPHGEVHYQDICPACRRRMVALNQGSAIGR
ncbi:MAG: MFS transporter [Limisphaerales bacterium]